LSRLEANHAFPGAEGLRRARHRLDRKPPPADIRQVAGEDLEPRPRFVRPDGCATGLDPPATRAVTRLVELLRSDPVAVEGHLVGRSEQVWMVAGAERARPRAGVLSFRAHGEPTLVKPVRDAQPHRERVTRLRVQDVLERDARLLPLDGVPARPAHEAVDRAAALDLVDRELQLLAFPLVAPVAEAVRPRSEDLSTARRAHLGGPVPEQDALPLSDAASDLDDHDPVPAGRELVLLARGKDHAVRTASES